MKKIFSLALLALLIANVSYAQSSGTTPTLKSLSEEIEQLKKLCSSQQDEISILTEESNDLRKRVIGYNPSYSSPDNITSLKNDVKNLREELHKLTGTSNSWDQPKIPDIQKRVNNLEEYVKKISGSSSNSYSQPNLNDLSKRISDLEKNVNSLEKRVNDVERYERRISDLERKIK